VRLKREGDKEGWGSGAYILATIRRRRISHVDTTRLHPDRRIVSALLFGVSATLRRRVDPAE
jgi:hypothetical protein